MKAKQENTVGVLLGEAEGEGKLVTRLTAVDNAITQILNDATAAKANYDNIIKVVAKGVNDRLTEAAKTTVSSYDNNALTYIWDFKTVNRKIEKKSLKAPWAETELAAIEKDRNELMKAAWEELGRFPKQTKAKAEWETDFNSLKDQVDNMIARAIVERDYKSKIATLKTKVDNLKNVLAIKDTDHKDVFTKPAGYDDWTKAVDELNKFIDDATNRRDFTKAELDANPVGKYTTAETTFTSLKGEFINQAHTALTARSKAAQDNIDTYSYKISAKYQNEPKTQEKYEKEFAVIQANLNTCNNTIKAKDYATIVEGFNTNSKQYKALKEKGWLSGIMQNEAMMSSEERMIYETFGGRDTIINNLMKQFDSEGDLLNANGVAGMDVTGKGTSWQQLTSVSEEYRQKMFDNVKREFIQENGLSNGDTTKRSDIFKDYQLSVSKDKRLSGTWTLEQYEGQYRAAMYAAVKSANPNWKPGQKFDTSILDNVTRESVESTLVKNGNRLVRNSIDVSV